MAKTFRVSHRTEYRYDRAVTLGPHRLLLRPRDGHDLRVIETSLHILPEAHLRWHFDTFGNSVATAQFAEPSDTLIVQSDLLLRRYALDVGRISRVVEDVAYSDVYSNDELIDLAPLIAMGHEEERPVVKDWLSSAVPVQPDTAFAFLGALSAAIHAGFEYSRRNELGTQLAAATIRKGIGTCRDFAFLFMESARSRGFAARFVTGYLHDGGALSGGGSTHAWAEVFIPHVGWIEFDPTNRIVGGAALIRVAATRTPGQASPITGSYEKSDAKFLELDVSVTVSEVLEGANDAGKGKRAG